MHILGDLDPNIIDQIEIDDDQGLTLDGKTICFQLPPVKVLFGISEKNSRYSIALSLYNYQTDPLHKNCHVFL